MVRRFLELWLGGFLPATRWSSEGPQGLEILLVDGGKMEVTPEEGPLQIHEGFHFLHLGQKPQAGLVAGDEKFHFDDLVLFEKTLPPVR